jgi:hypothetical protein
MKIEKRWVREGGFKRLEFRIVQIKPNELELFQEICDTRERRDLSLPADLLAQETYDRINELLG